MRASRPSIWKFEKRTEDQVRRIHSELLQWFRQPTAGHAIDEVRKLLYSNVANSTTEEDMLWAARQLKAFETLSNTMLIVEDIDDFNDQMRGQMAQLDEVTDGG